MQNNDHFFELQTRYNTWRAQVMMQERSIQVRAEKTSCNTKQGKMTKTRPTRTAVISNLDREIQLEEAIEQRRTLTNRTF